MPRESSKCREWEKDRRNRLNEAFASVYKLLPNYDPSVNSSKFDILKKAASYIEELQTKIKDLLSNNAEASKNLKGEEYKKLLERIKKLLGKNEQLCALLRDAKIAIPQGCCVAKKFKSPKVWSNRILPEQAKILQRKEAEKENDAEKATRKFPEKKQKVGQNSAPKHRKAIINRSDSKKVRPKKKKMKPLTPSKCVIVLSQPNITPPCYVITNASSNNVLGGTSTVITNSGLVSNPLVSSKATKTVSSIPPLGPGTLILADGTIMPVLPQQTVLPIAPQIITRPPIILVKNSVSTASIVPKIVNTGTKTTRIRPKYCLTKTTQVNKVPIPALTSRYSNVAVVLKKSEPKPTTKDKKVHKEVEKIDAGEKRKASPEESNEAKKAKTVETEKEGEVPEVQVETAEKNKSNEVREGHKSTEEQPQKTVETEKKQEENLELNINHSELSNDIFASLQVPAGCQNPESTSPTAAFLLAFPLVSSLTGVKVTEVTEEDNTESQRGTPTLLQIGTMDSTKPTQSENLTPSLLNLDNLSFFSSKDIGGFYNSFDGSMTTSSTTTTVVSTSSAGSKNCTTTTTTAEKPVLQHQQNQPIQQQPQKPQQQQTRPHAQQTLQQTMQQQQPQQALQQQQTRHPQPQPKLQQQAIQQPQQSLQPQSQQALPSQRHQEKNQLIPCFDHFGTNENNSAGYQSKPTENKQQAGCVNTYNQKHFPSFSTTCSYNNNKSYPEPLYTNSTTYSYSNTSDTNFNQNYYKDIKSDNRSYYSLNYENYADYRKNDSNTYFSTSNYYSNSSKFNNTQKPKNGAQSRPPINWMTTPDNRLQTPTDYVLPQFTKEADFYPSNTFTNTQTTYFNTNPMYSNSTEVTTNNERRKSLDLSLVPPVNTYQRNEVEDNQFSWSPTKIPQFLDPPHNFVSSTLPTLVGDLALGNSLNFEQKGEKCQKKDTRRLKNYEGGNNQSFLSVSQLVDHNKEVVPARTTTRRNSGNRSSGKKVPPKTSQRKESNKVENPGKGMKQLGYAGGGTGDIFCDTTQKNRNVTKNSYSAEALIGHQMQSDQNKTRQQNFNNKPISVSSFLHDNIIPYFPTVDLPQDNTYIQQNQNYQTSSFSHNFPSTFQNNTYTANTFIPSTTSYNFMHDVPTHDYSDLFPPMNKDKNCGKGVARNQQCPPTPKKSKRKHSNDLPGFVDFSLFPMPGTINSPILPDDFHTHTGFLQPPTPQLYPCKNPFTKPNDLGSGALLPLPPVPTRSNIQHPEISPINSAGTSLTNFNLSTIFPEITNKDGYTDGRVKENPRYTSTQCRDVVANFNLSTIFPEITNKDGYTDGRVKQNPRYTSTQCRDVVANFNLNTIFPEITNKHGYTDGRVKENPRYTSTQVSFNDKPTFSFSYINGTTSQSYNQ